MADPNDLCVGGELEGALFGLSFRIGGGGGGGGIDGGSGGFADFGGGAGGCALTLPVPIPGGPGSVDAEDTGEGATCCSDSFLRAGGVVELFPAGGGGGGIDGGGAVFFVDFGGGAGNRLADFFCVCSSN